MITRPFVTAVALLWLAGTALRFVILATPPVLPLIHHDLHLSATGIGILNGLPIVLFACAAIPGSLFIAKFGAFRTLIAGLLIAAIAGALRGAIVSIATLYAATTIMGLGIAIMQPAIPVLVRQWMPRDIAFATAVYTNGLLVGEIFPAALTIPLILPLVGQSWPLALAVWSIPLIVIAGLIVMFAPSTKPVAPISGTPGPRWWPNWRDGLIWRVGFIFGSANSMYFGANAFLPDYLNSAGRGDLISPALTALNLGQLPASFVMLAVARRLERRAWPYIAVAGMALLSVIGLAVTPGVWTIVSAATLGYAAGSVLVLTLALPPMLCAPGDIARSSAGMFTISYAAAVVVAIISGAVWDLTAIPRMVFLPLGLCALFPVVLAPTIPFHRRPE